jgi:3-hydroxyacyl-[acyl-carrier-protein] dehydratase
MTQSSSIQDAIPHRPPMLLVDEVLEQTDDHIVCQKTYRPDEFFFQGHYPDFPLVPGVILCESAMQAGAILLSRYVSAAAGAPVATRMNDVRFKQMIRPGDTTVMDVRLYDRLADAFFLRAKVTCRERLAVRFEFACTIASVATEGP